MKHTRFTLSILVFLLGAFLLSACSGVGAANSWPGTTVTEDALYSAFNNHVYSLNPANGSINWQFPAAGADAKVAFFANPVVAGDLIVAGDFVKTLHAINRTNGTEQWIFEEASGRWIAAPIVVEDLIIAPNAERDVFALNMNGLVQWKFETEGQNWAQPSTDGENVYISSMDRKVYALRSVDGKKLWSTDLGAAVIHSQILSDEGVLYIGTLGSEMLAVNSANGKILWRCKTPGSIWGKAVLQDDVLYVGDQVGKISAISTKAGSTLWSVDAGGPVIGAGTILGDTLIFGTETGSLVAFDTTGKKLWNVTVSGKLYSDILVAGENVIGSAIENDKSLQAFDKDGKEIWGFISPK
ncbi:MAG: PQQ-binding-like beta-propeller repeat protein [Anaerolineaceae bacterium]